MSLRAADWWLIIGYRTTKEGSLGHRLASTSFAAFDIGVQLVSWHYHGKTNVEKHILVMFMHVLLV